MISTSYDIDDNNPRNSSNSLNDEESIFLSSSSDEDLPLSSRFAVSNSLRNQKNKYMETMINDGCEDEEDSEESLLSEEAEPVKPRKMYGDSDEEESDEEDEECQYIPTTTYNEEFDDRIEDVSDDDESMKSTKIYDEYDPENIDHFNDSSLLKNTVEYEPTKLNKSESEEESSPDVKKTRKTRHTRAKKILDISPQPENRVKRKYNRRQTTIEAKKEAASTSKRPYNNTNRAKNAEMKKIGALKETEKRTKKKESVEMVVSPQVSPVSSESLSDNEQSNEIEITKKIKKAKISSLSSEVDAIDKSDEKKKKRLAEASKQPEASNKSCNSVPTSNVINGRIINLSSGFKIPKRPSNEAIQDKSLPPEKKAKKISEDSTNSTESSKSSVKTKSSRPIAQPLPTDKIIRSTKPIKPVSKDSKESKDSKASVPVQKSSKPQKMELKESDLFMEALGTSKPSVRPKPKIPKVSTSNGVKFSSKDNSLSHSNSESKTKSETSASSFNPQPAASDKLSPLSSQQTLNQTNNLVNINNRSTSPNDQKPLESVNNDEKTSENNSGQSKSNLSEPGFKKATKKKVVWADSCSKQLESVSFFYLDETEREIKKNAFKGGDMAKIEKLNEKELKFKHHDEHEPVEIAEVENVWPTLIPLDLPDSICQPEVKSVEHDIQIQRELNTLGVLMFKEFLPPSPSEPDLDNTNKFETITSKIIPLEDVTLNQSSDIDTSIDKNQNEVNNQEANESNSNSYNSTSLFNQQNNFNDASNAKFAPKKQFYNENYKNGKDNNHGYYAKNNHYNQHRRHMDQDSKSNIPSPTLTSAPKLFTPASPPRSPPKTFTKKPSSPPRITSTPLSPTSNAPKLYSKAIEDSPQAEKKSDSDASSLISISNSLLSSDEMTEKIKLILKKVNEGKAESNLNSNSKTPAISINTETNNNTAPVNKLMSITDIEFNSKNTSPHLNGNNSDYKKSSKWNNYNNQKYGQNNNSQYGSSHKNNNEFNNRNNNRPQFQNNFRRGIGNRHDSNSHSNFNKGNFNNNNDGYHSKFNRNNNYNDGSFRGKNHNSRFDHHKKESRFEQGNSRNNNYENDMPTKNTTTTNSAGRWI